MSPAIGKIHHGDCVAGMSQLDAGSIDLVFADPPFNIGYTYDVYEDKRADCNRLDKVSSDDPLDGSDNGKPSTRKD